MRPAPASLASPAEAPRSSWARRTWGEWHALPTLLRSRLPGRCEVCGTVSHAADRAQRSGGASLCRDCVQCYAAPPPRCRRCGIGLGSPAAACGACLADPPPFSQTVCALDYGFPWNRVIASFKFEDRPELAGALALRLAAAVDAAAQDAAETWRWPDRVVPVPLSRQRLRERGYNQAWELARHVAASFDIAADPQVLLRPRETPHQADLDRAARLLNLRGAFMVDPRRRPWVAGHDMALVDDVMTTGATAREAAAVLLRAGAASVQIWALARTE